MCYGKKGRGRWKRGRIGDVVRRTLEIDLIVDRREMEATQRRVALLPSTSLSHLFLCVSIVQMKTTW